MNDEKKRKRKKKVTSNYKYSEQRQRQKEQRAFGDAGNDSGLSDASSITSHGLSHSYPLPAYLTNQLISDAASRPYRLPAPPRVILSMAQHNYSYNAAQLISRLYRYPLLRPTTQQQQHQYQLLSFPTLQLPTCLAQPKTPMASPLPSWVVVRYYFIKLHNKDKLHVY